MENAEVVNEEVVANEENVEEAAAAAAPAEVKDEGNEVEAAEEMEAEHDQEGAADASCASPDGGAKKIRRTEPVKLGYRTFHSCGQATDYFKRLLQTPALGTDFNEYEHLALLDLLKKGHPAPESKIGDGLRSFQVRRFSKDDPSAKALFAVRKDGSAVDFSYVKCLASIYPGEVEIRKNIQPAAAGAGGGRGRGGRGGGGGARGRGGGGRGRGRN